MKRQPLFMRFVNNEADDVEVLRLLQDPRVKSSPIVQAIIRKGTLPYDLKHFRQEFSVFARTVADDQAITPMGIMYLNDYMSALIEYVDKSHRGQDAFVAPLSEDLPWPEALICYDFSSYYKAVSSLGKGRDYKSCRSCKRLFDHKGPHAVYCSETCKNLKGSSNAGY